MRVHGYEVRGVGLDGETRCAHYGTERDVVAIKFACCATYYACHRCHEECTDHERSRWPLGRRDEKAVLCGVCGTELAVQEYLGVDSCPDCGARFNPGCNNHTHLYFEERPTDGT
ncbi:zinc finger protein [Natronomonas pharaonis DSM 2160]|uniref:Zinc finger protein n=1 Tax=Natronomonas pharaonis (strain ATCC 35678 / DSM 2160 / CIP 103997 / JCM 8858 / NBRC 14720 / NCIMB 2260 / Gabara) TaxID=348780 RepID=A0A1U7EWY0_NATPD|nr:CHY zinc finger protein [Natronomonas pharaonis]CAI49617.1 zinc finger protein [Natronomonas pharaonis DSM 2160]